MSAAVENKNPLLAGLASTVGGDEYNEKLAPNKAMAIQALLLDLGVVHSKSK